MGITLPVFPEIMSGNVFYKVNCIVVGYPLTFEI